MNINYGIKSTDYGMNKFGYNDDVDAAETIWAGGGAYPWAEVGTNEATTIVSASANDDAAGTGLRTCIVEGLVEETINGVTGGRIYRETVSLDGTTAVTLDTEFSFVYRIVGQTAGSGGVNAGVISVKHGTDTIAACVAGSNATEMAVMEIPRFTSDGHLINGAWLINWYAAFAKTSTAYADMVLKSKSAGASVFAVRARDVVTQTTPVEFKYDVPLWFAPGSQIEVAATAVSATNSAISGGFALKYEV